MIRFENVKYERDGFSLAADFKVDRASLCAVLGPSGAGKSTLLSLVAGFEDLRSGRILIDETVMTGVPPAARPVHFVFQSHNDFPHLSLFDNVALGLSPRLKLDVEQRMAVDSALARVGLAALGQRKPGQVSGGELQRMALARALVRAKPVLLLDEPFASLDPGLRREMLALVVELHHEHRLTTLLVTHQPEEARSACDAVVFVADGVARAPVETERFFQCTDEVVKRYLG